jgi:N-alpha-acetyltransferase 15/16, NatA auxiliary subunit
MRLKLCSVCLPRFVSYYPLGECVSVLNLSQKDAASPGADLTEMQSTLYLLEEARAHADAGRLGLALKRCNALKDVFAQFEDDQYDFHGYATRKFNLNAYIK